MSPDDAYLLYGRLVLWEMPADMKLGMYLAFYRTFGIASIGGLLLSTGESTHRARRRADDTGLLMYTLFYFGFERAEGITAMQRLRRIHARFDIGNDDYLYVLACLAVVPTRWTDRHGRRRLTDAERHATAMFYGQLGERLGITGIPAGYEDLEAWFDAFDESNLRPDPAGAVLMRATRELMVSWLPRWLRPAAGRLAEALLDERLRLALGVARPNAAIRSTARLVLRVRQFGSRLRGPAAAPAFTPGQPTRSYPHGYLVDQLGPAD